jgi:hypothetical protein
VICGIVLKLHESAISGPNGQMRKKTLVLMYRAVSIFLDMVISLICREPTDSNKVDSGIKEIEREHQEIMKSG